ncbi:N-acyl-L-amino acid amidohydrolase [Sphingobacterium mizutaii NBRC 14946 = DSM 11724]|uniref:N-acyl-L-amino acid amidohydrolase n=2 Tax=Sphingobacterium mizutaii TaxID=1010 RepID=A0AAJ5BYM4_9SPHI|nr:M20 family metallopeptidase [Sphingobacterium mizutaii]GEM66922.1 N-acyl-L-amino acid amidohydrolase [Sphingobacterium mizutaii NBRC 14946 = DSM 11724]SDL61327.1 amidohydrolase [Sphingobacterium mizutaii]SNV34984.1 N-acyl-L-amino acid amidohydrolase [Sphingobacterium mizutaii]
MPISKQRIQDLAQSYFQDTVNNRRFLHQNPELSFEEYNTSAFIKQELTDLEIPFESMANTGVVALIKGDLPSDKVLALRADMDALPITEVEGRSYGSKNVGVMHACGHDVHTSSLLGVAKILNDLKPEFGGTLKLIFQPGEERLPGGASLMIKEGVLQNPEPQGIVGQHVMPFIEAGKVGFRSGKYMASCDELFMTVRGKGGHGAQPHQNIDPIAITAQIISAMQQIVSRVADPRTPSVLSWGKIIGNGATNVIPEEVYLEGTFRTFDEKWRAEAHEKMHKMAVGIAEGMGASCDFEIRKGYPFLINEPKITEAARSYAQDYLGHENVVELDLWPAAEDFAYYSQETNACFYRLGTGNQAKGIQSAVHTSTFDIDETALQTSIGLMSYIALRHLGE